MTTALAAGALVVVELTNECDMHMIGVVKKPSHAIVQHKEVREMGRLEPGDEVLEVHTFEPTQADSNRYNLTGNHAKTFPVCVEDGRDGLRALAFVDHGEPRRSSRNAGTSSAEVHTTSQTIVIRRQKLI